MDLPFLLYNFFRKRTTTFLKNIPVPLAGAVGTFGGRRMKAVGIIAEYDPFHLGHQYHIQETKRRIGGNPPVVCVMSGNWVQRGTCALTDKWTRTALALQGGVDLVLELPVWWAVSSAERFARGGVELLDAMGVIEFLSFGSEGGDVERFQKVAECLDSSAYRVWLRRFLDRGISFPRSRQEAVRELLGEEFADCLAFPNNNLGVEYIRALNALQSEIRPIPVRRRGVFHNAPLPGDNFASASYLREAARRGDWNRLEAWTPYGTVDALRRAGLANQGYLERAMLARLRSMREDDFSALPDSGAAEGLPARLVRSVRRAGSLEEFYTLAKTKRYTRARLQRLAVWSLLGITEQNMAGKPLYLRVLGMNERGKGILKEMKSFATLPVLTKSAHIDRLGREVKQQFELECKATDLYELCLEKVGPCGLDYTIGPVISRVEENPNGGERPV